MRKVPVLVPKLSMAVVNATFIEWLVGDGEPVEEEQPLYTAATEKAEVEVPSPATGILRHGVAEPEVEYAIATELAIIEVPDAKPT